MTYGEERRRAPRIQVLGRLHGHVVSLDTHVTVREVSLVGLSFAASISFPVGAVHEFLLTLGDDSSVLLRGRVVRCEEASAEGTRSFVTGVQFLDDEDGEDSSALEEMIDRVK